MGRRSDHSRDELRQMLVAEGHRHMAEVGFARFSAREVAKRIGYSVGTVYNVFGSHDAFLLAVNTRSFRLWTGFLRAALERGGEDRIATLVQGYFDFARDNRHCWRAIHEHHLPPDWAMPEEQDWLRGELTELVVAELLRVLPPAAAAAAPRLARSLIAIVHGHCVFDLNGSFRLMGQEEPVALALERVRDCLAMAGAPLGAPGGAPGGGA